MLEELGCSALEDKIYRHLLGVASDTRSAIAEAVSTPSGEVGLALAGLESRGLVSRGTGRPTSYLAAPPNVAVSTLLLKRQEALLRVEAELTEVLDAYRRSSALRSVTEIVEVIPEPNAARDRIARLLRGAEEEYLGLVAPPFMFTMEEGQGNPIRVAGVARSVCDQRFLEHPGSLDLMRGTLAPGEEVRVHPHVPMKMAVVDREVAVLSAVYAEAGPPAMMLVHRSTLLDALVGFFELIWSQAVPLHVDPVTATPAGGLLSSTDQHLLSLLMSGLTDQAIAAHLGVGHRSVQRRVRELMDLARVRTRIQLGWRAHEHGWLGGEPDPGPTT